MNARVCIVFMGELTPLRTRDGARYVERAAVPLRRELVPAGLESFEFSLRLVENVVAWALPLDSVQNLRSPVGLAHHACRSVSRAQVALFILGAILRGGIAVGDVTMGDDRMFGPAVTRAGVLRALWATYPRVVVDPLLLRVISRTPLLRATHHDGDSELGYVRRQLRRDDDGMWRLDPVIASLEGNRDEQITMMRRRRDMIRSALDEFADGAGPDAHLRDLTWLAADHNRVVARCGLDDGLFIVEAPMLFG